ncbi:MULTISPECIES: hypothetical protein [unclassified Pseudomonas]|uniref:hypothetical protein n=1 Tax=unclassified Pseudomonas TaxID=196821 RepID=UPI0008769A97|nr:MULTISPECIES: hypothetical protein [unclassified Pseudomonas]SCZ75504.1 hypothetical protein SAMN03159460_05787 [Pseudomonas sp. NFPP17]SDA88220.1 hypothetical protein SAMN03159464_05867 [Pseudomonas sp. NFPP15]SEL98845.1 hypothetical protein SAMN03159324_06045 [Pseudomonas sp. NFPP18]SFA68262.1 hypothetical protein SAMN03159320_05863 [Pseudomonas sp. NFPP13]SFU12047.1 hypothetical protein SAMN03159492_05986 [Pseudomonas sp. NFPP25]
MKEKKYYLIVFLIISINIFIASRYISISPIVDGWAVWNRVMLLNFNELSFIDYLLNFFGAHPHSVVMLLAWIDYHAGNANQIILAIASFSAIAAFALFCTHRFQVWTKKINAPGYGIFLGGAVIALLTTTLADQQVMTIPFQAVLSISRLSYIVLLWALIRALRENSAANLSIVTILSCFAVTFHGSGPIFSLLFIAIHCMMYKGPWRFLTGFAPVAATATHSYFYKLGGELDNLGSLISLDGFVSISKALFGYFASILLPFLGILGENTVLIIGAIVFLFTACIACYCLLDLIVRRLKKAEPRTTDDEKLFAGILSAFILLSGAAAAILMTVRVGPDSYKATLSSSRYIAYSLLSYAMMVCVLVYSLNRKNPGNILRLSGVAFIGIIGLYPTLTFKNSYSFDIELNKAIAAISIGVSPLVSPADAIWPLAKDDWYWVNSLPQTVSYLKEEKLGPWSKIPALHQIYMGKKKPKEIEITNFSKASLSCNGEIYNFSGTLPAPARSQFLRSKIITIIDVENKVIGFAVQTRSQSETHGADIQGYIVTNDTQPPASIFLAPPGNFYIGKNDLNLITSYNLTDSTWLKGFARNWPGFFVKDTQENRQLLVPGSLLKFSNGDYRLLTEQIIANGFVNVRTNGTVLNAEAIGYPKPIRIINPACQ